MKSHILRPELLVWPPILIQYLKFQTEILKEEILHEVIAKRLLLNKI